MNMSRVVKSKNLNAVPFTIKRNRFRHQDGLTDMVSTTEIMATGVIYPGNAESIDQLPEEHKHDDYIFVFSDVPLSLGVWEGARFTGPDRIRWNGQLWRLVRLLAYGHYGFWEGLAVLVPGER